MHWSLQSCDQVHLPNALANSCHVHVPYLLAWDLEEVEQQDAGHQGQYSLPVSQRTLGAMLLRLVWVCLNVAAAAQPAALVLAIAQDPGRLSLQSVHEHM